MSTERLIASHLRLAAEALTAADLLLSIGNRNAAYQAQQAVEQMILALAQAERLHVARSIQHQLETMRRLLPDGNAFRDELASLTWLEAFATAYRYPKTMGAMTPPPDPVRLGAATKSAGTLLARIAAYFEVDLDSAATRPALHVRPPRLT